MSGHVIKRNVGSCSPQGRRFGHISVVAMFHFVVNVFGEYLKQQIEDLQKANKEKEKTGKDLNRKKQKVPASQHCFRVNVAY